MCGTNESATRKPLKKILDDCKALVTMAKSKNVHISSILPHTDKRANMSKIIQLSQMLVIIYNEQGVQFINNDLNFQYRDDIPDTSMLLPCYTSQP